MNLPFKHPLEFRLLGGFTVLVDGMRLNAPFYNKMCALLAYLAVQPEQDFSRDLLAELLWGDSGFPVARDNLRRTLSNLRRAVEQPSGVSLFAASKHSIRFLPNAFVDAHHFLVADTNNAESLIPLYHGEFLMGLELPDCPEFDYWLQIQRETLHRHVLGLLEQQIIRHQHEGNWTKALSYALRHSELDPWNERAHRQVMQFYALNGQCAAAQSHYQLCCRLLQDGLGQAPETDTRTLAEQISKGDYPSVRQPSFMATDIQATTTLSAERRQVTVLYCELCCDEDIELEDELALLGGAVTQGLTLFNRYHGHCQPTHGSGLLVYFGYPKAQEHAARYAVQTALNLIADLPKPLTARIGIHTGLVITGGAHVLPDTAGRTSRFAIHLQRLAATNEVLISQETLHIVQAYIRYHELSEPLFFSGLLATVRVYQVTASNGEVSRIDTSRSLTPLVGRSQELQWLVSLWQQAQNGNGQKVLIQGEAGIGKSRLLYALKTHLLEQTCAVRELRCFPEHRQSPFQPLLGMLAGVFGHSPHDSPEQKSTKLIDYLQRHYPDLAADAVPLLAQLLALPYPAPTYKPPGGSANKQKEQTIGLLLQLLQALSVQQPVLLMVEDLHWADPSTVDLLTALVKQSHSAAVLIIFTARETFVPPWPASAMQQLALLPLSEQESGLMARSLNQCLSAAALDAIIKRADGIPLFIEEIVNMFSHGHNPSLPTSLQDLLAARIDALGEAKATAQLASALGRDFPIRLLEKIADFPPGYLTRQLTYIENSNLVVNLDNDVWQFKHALIQEAAYQSLTKTHREHTHLRIADILLADYPAIVTNQPELLAQHLTAAEQFEQAIQYWLCAGQRAFRQSANVEAFDHFQSALQLIHRLPATADRDTLEIEASLNLGMAAIAAKGYGSVEAGQAYGNAFLLSQSRQDGQHSNSALWGMWLTSSSRVNHSHSLELAWQLLAQAGHGGGPLTLQQAHYALGNSLLWTGQIQSSQHHLQTAMSLYQPEHHDDMVRCWGENLYVSCGALRLFALWQLGHIPQAVALSQHIIALARQIEHPFSLGFALCCSAILQRWMGDVEECLRLAQEAVQLSDEYGLSFWHTLATSHFAWAKVMQGQTQALDQLQWCFNAASAVMSGTQLLFLMPLIEALQHAGHYQAALSKLDDAFHIAENKHDRLCESELYRLKGECLLAHSVDNWQQAKVCFKQAVAISRQQAAMSLQTKAANSIKAGFIARTKNTCVNIEPCPHAS